MPCSARAGLGGPAPCAGRERLTKACVQGPRTDSRTASCPAGRLEVGEGRGQMLPGGIEAGWEVTAQTMVPCVSSVAPGQPRVVGPCTYWGAAAC